MLSGAVARGRDLPAAAEAVAVRLTASGVADQPRVLEAITALRVAIAETPRRGTINKTLTSAVAEAVRQAVAAVRSCDAGCAALVSTLSPGQHAVQAPGRRTAARRGGPSVMTGLAVTNAGTGLAGQRPVAVGRPAPPAAEPAPAPGRRSRPEPVPGTRRSRGPARSPRRRSPPHRPRRRRRTRAEAPAARPVRRRPRRPVAASRCPAGSTARPPARLRAAAAAARDHPDPGAARHGAAGRGREPFRPTLTNAAINSARAERRRTVTRRADVTNFEPSRPSPHNARWARPRRWSAPPIPGSRCHRPTAAGGSAPAPGPTGRSPTTRGRANGEPHNPGPTSTAATGERRPADRPGSLRQRVTPPWLADDLPPEPPMLRLVEPPPLADRALREGLNAPAASTERRRCGWSTASRPRRNGARPPAASGLRARAAVPGEQAAAWSTGAPPVATRVTAIC